MSKRIVGAASAAFVLSLSIAAAQTGTPQTGTSQTGTQDNRSTGAVTQQETTMTGCVARAPGATGQNAMFMLNNVQAAGGAATTTGVSGSTSARPGVSASGAGDRSTSGTAGSTSGRTGATEYTLMAGANQDLATYVGQRVEVRGRVMGNAGDAGRNTATTDSSRTEGSTSASAGSGSQQAGSAMSRFQITSIRRVDGTCK